jgi:tRNA (cmo5U34)-methyltransferase
VVDAAKVIGESATPTGGWNDRAQVRWYLERIGNLPPRLAGEEVLLQALPASPHRVLDLGCGDGRLTALILDNRQSVESVTAVDNSTEMLALAGERFRLEPRVSVVYHDLAGSLAPLGETDLVVSGFAIHHLRDERKRALFGEVARQLTPGGIFLNLEVVASATPQRHAAFLAAIGRTADDPEDRLAPVEVQLNWMRDAGLTNVDCLWRWRGFALLAAEAS